MKLFDIAKIKKSKWLELGGKLVTRIVEDADNGISQDGSGNSRDFASYSPEYVFKKDIHNDKKFKILNDHANKNLETKRKYSVKNWMNKNQTVYFLLLFQVKYSDAS